MLFTKQLVAGFGPWAVVCYLLLQTFESMVPPKSGSFISGNEEFVCPLCCSINSSTLILNTNSIEKEYAKDILEGNWLTGFREITDWSMDVFFAPGGYPRSLWLLVSSAIGNPESVDVCWLTSVLPVQPLVHLCLTPCYIPHGISSKGMLVFFFSWYLHPPNILVSAFDLTSLNLAKMYDIIQHESRLFC